MIRHSLIGCSVDQLAPRALSYWQPRPVIRRVKSYNQNADRRDDEVIAFDWPCPLLAQSGHGLFTAMSAFGLMRTSTFDTANMSANDPKRTKRASRVGKKVPPSERPVHSVTNQYRGFGVRQHLVCYTTEHNCG